MSDISTISALDIDVNKIDALINEHATFKVFGVADIGALVMVLEERIEAKGLKCRIYTEYRAAGIAGEVLLGGVGALVGAGIAVHNLATWDPDYEIGKNKLDSSITVTYKK